MSAEEIKARVAEADLADPLDPEALERLEGLAEELDDPPALLEAAEELDGDASLYLRGLALATSEGPEEALGPWLTLCDHLAQAGAWKALERVAIRALNIDDSPAAARRLLEAGEATGDREAAKDLAETLLRILPADPRAALVAGRSREDEGRQDATELYARAFEGGVRKEMDLVAEEAFLRVIEADDRAALERAVRGLVEAAAAGRTEWASGLLELGESAIHEAGLDEALVDWASKEIKEGADLDPLRGHLIAALRRAHEGKAWLPKLLELTGIEDEEVDLRRAFGRIDEVFAFPPGRYVAHHSFGVGPVLDTDGEKVIIDFPETGRKEMTASMAQKALTLLDPEDIRSQMAREGEVVAGEVEEDPVAVLVRALRHLGGEGTAKEIRGVLTPEVLPDKGWTSWWKPARDKALEDPRLATAEAYRDVYRIATGREEDALPALGEIPDREKAMELLRRFLTDQPEKEDQAREAWAPVLEGWLGEQLQPATRARILLRLDDWCPEQTERWVEEAGGLFSSGLGVGVVPTAGEQERLLELGMRSTAMEDAALSGLLSRFVGVRQKAMDGLVEAGDEALEAALRKVLAQGEPASVIQVARWYADGGEAGFGEELSPWRLVAAVLSSLTKEATGKTERDLLDLLDPEGPLAGRLAEVPTPSELHGALRMGLRALRNHFQLSHRAERFLEATGAGEVLDTEQESPDEGDRKSALLEEGLLVSRGTAHRLERKVERLKKELQTTIPAEILKAREYGDLRENAEYKAAKEKQALTAQTLEELKQSLQSVRFLEDLPWEEGRILPGAELVLEDAEGERREIWLLGDGEDYLGEHVISHRSPLGQALLWKEQGQTVRLPRRGEEIEYRIVQVQRRLPSREETEAEG